MKTVLIQSLPQICFAHVYDAPQYYVEFWKLMSRIECTYLYKGSLSVTEGETALHFEEGDIYIMLFDAVRSVRADGYHCHHTVAAHMERQIGEDLPDGLYLPPKIPAAIVPPEAYRLIDDLIYLQNMQMVDCTQGRTKFLELLCLLDACSRKASSRPIPRGIYLTNKVKKYVSEHIREPITQREVADHLGITPGYLCTLFKEAQGEPLMHYINKIKLQNIRSLMENEAVTLHTASAAFGYTDPNYVSRLYKQLFGQNITFRV